MAGFWFLDLFFFFFLNPAKTEKIYSVVYIRVIFNVFNLLAYCLFDAITPVISRGYDLKMYFCASLYFTQYSYKLMERWVASHMRMCKMSKRIPFKVLLVLFQH